MAKYLFILGRNIELSLAELKSVLGEFEFVKNKNAILTELESLDENIIDRLGGVIAIGKVICNINELENKEIYFGAKNNFTYCIWDFSTDSDLVSETLKKKFKQNKLKASEKRIHEEMHLQGEGKVKVLNSKRLVDEEYFVFEESFGKVIKKTNYKSIEERDMKKPHRRESLSISPRLAKIIINLPGAKKGETLLDGFCGVGVVLQEALLQNIKVVGIDKDKDAISSARENLEWFKFEKQNYKLICDDSAKVKIGKVGVMVSEPDFGKILRKAPTTEYVAKALKDFENLMIRVINNLKANIKGRIVFTCPNIKTMKGRKSCDFEKIVKKTGLEVMEGFPISEFRKNKIVGRDVLVLERR
ncbi:MAG: methyltransferase domain-containing protein [Candidatus Pacearchaeota archaeon]|jgi:tRNA G10  N-methylase Trm11